MLSDSETSFYKQRVFYFSIMKTLGTHDYYVYILTNFKKNVLYIGVTNDVERS